MYILSSGSPADSDSPDENGSDPFPKNRSVGQGQVSSFITVMYISFVKGPFYAIELKIIKTIKVINCLLLLSTIS